MPRVAAALLTTLALAGCQGSDQSGWTADQPVAVSSVGTPVAVSGVAQPVAVSGVAQPVAVSGVAQPVAVSGVTEPVAISSVAAPVRLVRPELDPERIETGDDTSGATVSCGISTTCQELIAGPFILTDVIATGTFYLRAHPPQGGARWSMTVYNTTSLTGARLAVRGGEKLVLQRISGALTWSGFRP